MVDAKIDLLNLFTPEKSFFHLASIWCRNAHSRCSQAIGVSVDDSQKTQWP